MDILFEEAKKHFMLDQNEQAEEFFSKFIETCNAEVNTSRNNCWSKQLAEAYNNRGQIGYLRVDFDKAIDDYTAAIHADDTYAVAYYNRGQIHYRLARFQEAIVDFGDALKHQPDFQDAITALRTAQEDHERSRLQGPNDAATDSHSP